MTCKPRRFWTVVTAVVASLIGAHAAVADHSHVEYPFDDFNTSGWSSPDLSPGSPFGGLYLGPADVNSFMSLFIMDALPTFPDDFSTRPVNLWFDVVGFDPATDEFEVSGISGAVPFSFELDSGDITGGSSPNFSFHLQFLLSEDFDDTTDILIQFNKTAGLSEWGLDNVVVDWKAIPEPTAAWFIAGLGIVLVARRRFVGRQRQVGR